MYRCIPKFCMQQSESSNLLQKQAAWAILGNDKAVVRDAELDEAFRLAV